MWICPRCETFNSGDVCIVCNEQEPKPIIDVKKEEPSSNSNTKFLGKVVLVLLAIIIVMMLAIIAILETQYSRANAAFENSEYERAKEVYSNISFYRQSNYKMAECDYNVALELIEDDRKDEARNILAAVEWESMEGELFKECIYLIAEIDREDKEYANAYEGYTKIAGYKDSSKKAENLKDKIYTKGVDKYEDGQYSDAEWHFAKVPDVKEADKYLTLIKARRSKVDLDVLYDIITFEDTKDVLELDEYIQDYLLGRWEASGDIYMEFYKKNNGIECRWNMPAYKGTKWQIENGIHYIGSSDNSWAKQCSYEIVSKDTVKVKCFKNNKTYKMSRK